VAAVISQQSPEHQYEGSSVATYIALIVAESEGNYCKRTYGVLQNQMCSQELATGSCLERAESSLHLLHSLFRLDSFCPSMLQTKVVNLSDVFM
jgi:hypothetical protein